MNLFEVIYKKKNIFPILLTFLIFTIDQYSKTLVLEKFKENSIFINEFINIDLIWNTGIGFGFLSFTDRLSYNIVSFFIATIILLLFYITLKSNRFEKIVYSLILGGALGNLYDRITYNAVPDFIDLHYYNFHWFTFNFADIFITIGIIILLAKGIFEKNV